MRGKFREYLAMPEDIFGCHNLGGEQAGCY